MLWLQDCSKLTTIKICCFKRVFTPPPHQWSEEARSVHPPFFESVWKAKIDLHAHTHTHTRECVCVKTTLIISEIFLVIYINYVEYLSWAELPFLKPKEMGFLNLFVVWLLYFHLFILFFTGLILFISTVLYTSLM